MIKKIVVSKDAPPILYVRSEDKKAKQHLLWMYNDADVSVTLNENAMCGRPKPKDGWIIELSTIGQKNICKTCRSICLKESET